MSYSDNNIGVKFASKTADGTKQPLIMQQISVRPFTRKSADLNDWRNANKTAEGIVPRRTALYNLYYDFSTTEAQIIAVWQKRLDAVTTEKYEFTDKDGNPVDAINELLAGLGWIDLLTEIMESKRWGYTMVEPTFFINDNGQNEFSIYSVPRKHMRPELGIIAKDEHSNNGTYVREGIYAKTVMEFGKTSDLGLLLSACMYAILKRGNLSDWAEFIEIFGRGIVDAQWDGFDEDQRQKLAAAIREMGGGGVIIRPAGTSIDIKGNGGNANGDLQDKFAAKMDGYISKVLLGTTETTDSSKSSGYAQAEIHQEQDEKKNESDIDFVLRNLNSRFLKVLRAAGFDTKGGTFVIKKTKRINKTAFEVHKSMRKDLDIPIDDDFFYEEYGVRKPDNYEELKKEALESKQAVLRQITGEENALTPLASDKDKDKKPANDKKELSANPSFWRRVIRLFQSAPVQATTPVAGAMATACCGNLHTIKLAAFVAEKVFDNISEGLIKRAWDAKGKLEFDSELFNYTATTLANGFLDGLRHQPVKLANLGFTYGYDDPATLTAYEMNLFRFAGVKTLYEAQQLNEVFRASNNFKEFYDTSSSLLKVHNRSWLETEYNTAVAAGESAATHARLSKQTDLFPYWEYKTVGDNKVRHSHQLLEGIILPWNSPLWKYILPPNDWNCRCYIVARTKGEVTKEQIAESEKTVNAYLKSGDFKKAAKGGWGINRADKGEVFTENQHYTKDYLDAEKQLSKLQHQDYNLKDLKASLKDAPAHRPKFDESQKDEAIADFISNTERATSKKQMLTDFSNRPVFMAKSTLRSHTTSTIDKYKDRHIYLDALDEVLKNPDEVWLNNYRANELNNYTYIRYYKDYAITVVARLKNDLSLEIETWHKENTEDLRRGLLIKK